MLTYDTQFEERRLDILRSYEILDSPVEEVFEDVTRLISMICDVPMAAISLVDRDRQWFLSEVGIGVRQTGIDTSFCAIAIQQSELFIVPDACKDERFVDNPLVTDAPFIRFYAGALLKTSDGYPLGALCVIDYMKRELNDFQKSALQILANQVMKLLDARILLRNQVKAIAQGEQATSAVDEAYRHEKRIAETLQRSLLVNIGELSLPSLRVVPLYEAASDEAGVGGDFYDAFTVGTDYVALVLGDVTGKGLDAASRTAEVKYALRAFLTENPHPGTTLERLNNFLCEFHDYGEEINPRFVVTSLGLFNIRTGEATFSYAGAEPTMILRRDGSSEMIALHGMPLGINKGETYETCVYNMEVGDTLLLVTDGFTEARKGIEFLGIEGLRSLARESNHDGTLRNWADTILRDVKAYAGGTLRDDACLLLVQRVSSDCCNSLSLISS